MALEGPPAVLRVSLLADVELRLNMTSRLVSEDYNAVWTTELADLHSHLAGYLRLAADTAVSARTGAGRCCLSPSLSS